MVDVKIKLLADGKIPVFKHKGDACCDCYAAQKTSVPHGTRKLVSLGFCIQVPEGYEAVLRPRSGLSKDGIDIAIGTIDSSYTGEVFANVINNGTSAFEIEKGDRICQMAIRETPAIKFTQVDELNDTERGDKGFGSTGI